jgi:hypothetical protein
VRETSEERLRREKALADAVELADFSRAWKVGWWGSWRAGLASGQGRAGFGWQQGRGTRHQAPTDRLRFAPTRLVPQGEGGAVAGAVLAAGRGSMPKRQDGGGGGAPATPPPQPAHTPSATRREPAAASRRANAAGAAAPGGPAGAQPDAAKGADQRAGAAAAAAAAAAATSGSGRKAGAGGGAANGVAPAAGQRDRQQQQQASTATPPPAQQRQQQQQQQQQQQRQQQERGEEAQANAAAAHRAAVLQAEHHVHPAQHPASQQLEGEGAALRASEERLCSHAEASALDTDAAAAAWSDGSTVPSLIRALTVPALNGGGGGGARGGGAAAWLRGSHSRRLTAAAARLLPFADMARPEAAALQQAIAGVCRTALQLQVRAARTPGGGIAGLRMGSRSFSASCCHSLLADTVLPCLPRLCSRPCWRRRSTRWSASGAQKQVRREGQGGGHPGRRGRGAFVRFQTSP